MKKLLIIIPIILLLTGCYDYKELNDLSIVTAISISLNDNNNYNLTIQVVNPKKETDTSSTSEPDFITYESNAKTLEESYKLLTKKSIKNIYEQQLQLIIIDENIAKNKLSNVLDFLVKNTDIRNEVHVLVSKDKDILKTLTPLNNISSKNIIDSLDSYTKNLSYTQKITLNKLIKTYQNKNQEIILPSIKLITNKTSSSKDSSLESNQNDTSVELSNTAIFKNNQLIGYLTNEESLALNFITNNIESTIINCNYNNNYVISEITKSKTKLKFIPKDKTILIKIDGKATITESYNNINTNDNMYKIEKLINDNIEDLITKSYKGINTKYDSDIYGLKDIYYKKYRKENNNIIKDYKIKVSSNIKLIEYNNILGGKNHE